MEDLVEASQVTIAKTEYTKNISDMLTKALPTYRHRELVRAVGVETLQRLRNLGIGTLFSSKPKIQSI